MKITKETLRQKIDNSVSAILAWHSAQKWDRVIERYGKLTAYEDLLEDYFNYVIPENDYLNERVKKAYEIYKIAKSKLTEK